MSIIDRVRSVVAARARPSIEGVTGSVLPGLLGGTAAGAITRGIESGSAAARAVLPKASSAPDLILGEVDRLGTSKAQRDRRFEQAQRQASGRPASAAPLPDGTSTQPAGPTGSQASPWTAAPLYGGMTLERYRQLFVESAMTARSWKNLFHVSIAEYKPSRESPAGAGPINLLAVDVSFAPCTMPGDVVNIGAANVDRLESTERVELRLTTFDDDRGSLKRWFIAKCDQAAHLDGTMGLPVDYLLTVTVIEMDPLGTSAPDERMHHKFIMRPTNTEVELSRRSPELQEVPMAFVQFDTFMVAR